MNILFFDTLQLILPHRLVEKKVNAEALNQTVTGEKEIWDFSAPADTYYNQVTIKVDLTEMEEAHKAALGEKDDIINAKNDTIKAKDADIKNLNDTILKRDTIIGKYSTWNQGELEIDSNGLYSFNDDNFRVFVKVQPDIVEVEVHDTTTITKVDTVEVEKIDSLKGWVNTNVKIIVKYKPRPVYVPDPIFTNVLNTEPDPVLSNPLQDEVYVELEPLTETEKLYFNLIARHAMNGEITMSSFEQRMSTDYDYTDTFIRGMDNSTINIGISQKYFQKANYKQAYNELKSKSSKFYYFFETAIDINSRINYNVSFFF